MKKRLPAFLAGMLTATFIFGLGVTALAASGAIGTIEFNTVGLVRDGEQVFYADEDYLLDNGNLAPTSILFTDPSGNGTTYLPVRRVAELFGAKIGWDGASSSVVLGEAQTTQPNPAPDPLAEPAPSQTAETVSRTVYTTATGKKYHRAGCRYLKNSSYSISLSDAQSKGYAPCAVCNP